MTTRSLCTAHQRWTVPHGGVHLHVHDATVCWSRQCPERGGVTTTTGQGTSNATKER